MKAVALLFLLQLKHLFAVRVSAGVKQISNKSFSSTRLNMIKGLSSSKWDKLRMDEEGPSFSKEDIEELYEAQFPQSQVIDKVVAAHAGVVLIGEGSHGTHEHYLFRAELTKQLIEKGLCTGVLIEGDFPDTAGLHRYITGQSDDSLTACLERFERFPSWMWGNAVMRDFVSWLHKWNMQLQPHQRTGIFGLDLYSLNLSMEKVRLYQLICVTLCVCHACLLPINLNRQHVPH